MAKTKTLKKKHDESTNPKSAFYMLFIGEMIEIICEGPSTSTEIGVFPIIANGFLLDLDDDFLYLSDDGITITRAVKRKNVVTVEIVKTISETDRVLMEVPVPDNNEEGN